MKLDLMYEIRSMLEATDKMKEDVLILYIVRLWKFLQLVVVFDVYVSSSADPRQSAQLDGVQVEQRFITETLEFFAWSNIAVMLQLISYLDILYGYLLLKFFPGAFTFMDAAAAQRRI
jgi:hypothetical protein